MTPDEAASPAELAFIERVRSDRARVRALVRRAIATGALLIAAVAVFFFAHGVPRWPSGELSPAQDAAVTTPPFPATAIQAAPRGALEQRIARLEDRLAALEDRATVLERLSQRPASAPSTAAPPSETRPTTPPGPEWAPPAPATSPRARRPETASVMPPRDVKPNPVVSPKRVAAVSPARATARRPETPAPEPTIGERVRRGWDTIERQVRRTPDEVVGGVKRLFAVAGRD